MSVFGDRFHAGPVVDAGGAQYLWRAQRHVADGLPQLLDGRGPGSQRNAGSGIQSRCVFRPPAAVHRNRHRLRFLLSSHVPDVADAVCASALQDCVCRLYRDHHGSVVSGLPPDCGQLAAGRLPDPCTGLREQRFPWPECSVDRSALRFLSCRDRTAADGVGGHRSGSSDYQAAVGHSGSAGPCCQLQLADLPECIRLDAGVRRARRCGTRLWHLAASGFRRRLPPP